MCHRAVVVRLGAIAYGTNVFARDYSRNGGQRVVCQVDSDADGFRVGTGRELGGDWVTKTVDGGQKFLWSSNGYNGVMVGSSFNFNPHNPDAMFLAFQDDNGGFTTDGGKTWNYRDVSGQSWGGHDYGAGQSGNVMWCGDAEGWSSPRRIRLSRDGGTTWEFPKNAEGKVYEWKGSNVSYTDPKNLEVIFASNWRSADRGKIWASMECDGVYGHKPNGTLFGRKDSSLVESTDSGATWKKVVDVENSFDDVAFDAKRSKYYFATYGELKSWEKGTFKTLKIPTDQYGKTKCTTVAVDPGQTDVVYGGAPRNIYSTLATVFRSRDAGATFENLTTGDGPREVSGFAFIRKPATPGSTVNATECGASPARRNWAKPIRNFSTARSRLRFPKAKRPHWRAPMANRKSTKSSAISGPAEPNTLSARPV